MLRAPRVVTSSVELSRVVAAAGTARIIALDVEGNGLFVYRSRLCTAQLAWEQDGGIEVAIVDTIATDAKPLGALLGPGGPPKVLHDFTFDMKLLAEAGIELAHARDTSVLARLLGKKATGLGSLLASELGIAVTKDLQQHDWSRRPLEPAHLGYLASDVEHLIALYEKLSADARALDIEDEVEAECAFKFESALAPPREKRPAYLRIKGAEVLDGTGLAVLRRLVAEREQIAEQWDLPPFKVAGNEVLLALAQSKPKTAAELGRGRRGMSARLLEVGPRLVAAVMAGIADGSVPAADLDRGPPFDRALVAARRAREKRLSGWRRAEAKARGVDEQVVLPGHCLADLVGLEHPDLAAIAGVKGLGAKRFERYGQKIASVLTNQAEPDGSPPPVDEPSSPEDGL